MSRNGFAKRGLGVSASDGGSSDVNTVTEAFDVPIQCPEAPGPLLAAAAVATLSALRRRGRG